MVGFLEVRGVEVCLVRALMKEYLDLQARAQVVDCAPTHLCEYMRGGRQGGVQTPAILNEMFQAVLGPLIEKWRRLGWGLVLSCPKDDY